MSPEMGQNDLQPCASLLKKLDISMVVFNFADMMTQGALEGQHVLVDQYTESAREGVATCLANSISEVTGMFITALIGQGIDVVVHTPPGTLNGEVVHDDKNLRNGYVYQGKSLVEKVLIHHFGADILRHVQIFEGTTALSTLKMVKSRFHLRPWHILLVHRDRRTIQAAKKQHMLAILVDDHRTGFSL